MKLLKRFNRLRKLWELSDEQAALVEAMNTPEEPKLQVFVPSDERTSVLLPMTEEEEAEWEREQEGWGDFIRRHLGKPVKEEE